MHVGEAFARFRTLFVLFSVLTAAACQTPPGDMSGKPDIELTWEFARVMLPSNGRIVSRRMKDVQHVSVEPSPYPVVVYMHGCTGLGGGDERFMRKLAAAGFAVIAPDSMARRYRPLQCDPKTKTGGYNLFVYDFRQEEIRHALSRLPEVAWANRSALFLIGASEGGVAAARYSGPEFKGRVIAQWTCQGGPVVRGLLAPPDEPVLSIVRKSDPWYDEKHTLRQAGDCSSFFEGRADATSLVIEKGRGHDVLHRGETIAAILAFLERSRVQLATP